MSKAIPRVNEIWPEAKVKIVLSIAPPPTAVEKKVKDLKTHFSKATNMVNYITTQMTDGTYIFEANDNHYKTLHKNEGKDPNKEAIFIRVKPNSKDTAQFQMDESDAQKMKKAMQDELDNNTTYMHQIIDAAGIIAPRHRGPKLQKNSSSLTY